MAARTRNGNETLSTAMTLLIQNQAQFVAHLEAHLDEDRRRFSKIESDLEHDHHPLALTSSPNEEIVFPRCRISFPTEGFDTSCPSNLFDTPLGRGPHCVNITCRIDLKMIS